MCATNSARARSSLEHERVDRDALLRAALHLAEGLGDRATRRRVVELDLAVLEVGRRLAVRDDHDLPVRRRVPLQDPPGEEQAVLEVRAVFVAVPAELGQGARLDLAGVVGEPDDREIVARVLRPDEGVERDGDLLRGEEAAAQQHRPAHVHEQDGGRAGQLLGPMDLEVGRARAGSAAEPRAAGAFSSRPSALNKVPRRSRWNGSPNSYGLVVSSRSPPRPERSIRCPPNASRASRENRSSSTFWPIRRVPRAVSSSRSPCARQVAGRLESPGQIVERIEVSHAFVAEQVAHLVAIERREVAGALDVGQGILEPVHRLEPGDLRRAPHRTRAAGRR